MKRYVVTIFPRALQEIERNAQWWADHHDVMQAGRWFNAVLEQLQSLREFPERCGLSAENPGFPFEIRDKLVGLGARPSYRAVFTIREDKVLVIAFLSAEQDHLMPNDINIEL